MLLIKILGEPVLGRLYFRRICLIKIFLVKQRRLGMEIESVGRPWEKMLRNLVSLVCRGPICVIHINVHMIGQTCSPIAAPDFGSESCGDLCDLNHTWVQYVQGLTAHWSMKITSCKIAAKALMIAELHLTLFDT